MNDQKSFYETINKDNPLNELSYTAICIIERSDTDKRYLKSNTMRTREEKLRNFFTNLLKWSILIVVVLGCLWAAFIA